MLKKWGRMALLWAGPLLVAAAGGWLWLQGGRIVATDNAYVKADMLSVSSEISGKVTEVRVHDNARVAKGDLLFRVDDQPYRIALARAEAAVAKVESDLASLRADWENHRAELERAATDEDYFRREHERLRQLGGSSAVSAAQVDEAEYRYRHAQKETEAARQALQAVEARLGKPDLPLEQHPDLRLARAELEQARLDLQHVETYAPMDGVVANFSLLPGEFVAAGAPLFSLVDDAHLWVEANFKETDLTFLEAGQSASVEIDTFPDHPFHGRVSSIRPGTGAEFSLLPAQNSSGNWVKVVQRIAVKLDLDEDPELQSRLRAGMSALVEVDTGHERRLFQ